MKKALALTMSMVLLLCAACAWAEEQPLTLEQLGGMQWSFSSGVGGWSTDMRTAADGTFSGEYHDSEMGEIGENYPNGTVYGCAFKGQMSLLEQLDAHSWKVRIDKLEIDGTLDEESIDDGIRYVTSKPYGISEGDEMVLYLPGTPIDMLSEDMQMWAHVLEQDPKPSALVDWFLSSAKNESGFVGYTIEE